MKQYRFAKIYTGYTMIEDGVLTIKNHKVEKVEAFSEQHEHSKIEEIYKDKIAIPGFIDSHNHGGYGIDFMTTDLEGIDTVMKTFPQEGVTTILPTVGAMKDSDLCQFIEDHNTYIAQQPLGQTTNGGLNVEGPFMNRENAGLQPEGALIDPDVSLTKKWIELAQGNIKVMTIAPELPGAIDVIKILTENNIITSAGHSSATMADMNAAIEAGCNQVTHLFNGMMGLHHREPGILGVALTNEHVYAEMAGFDLHSIHPSIWKLAFQIKGPQRMILSTDALTLKGLPDGKYQMMDREIELIGGRLFTAYDGGTMHPGVPMTFVGSAQNCMKYTGATIEDIVMMSSINPAKQMRLTDSKGSLQQGKDADFLVVDEQLNITATYCHGLLAFEA